MKVSDRKELDELIKKVDQQEQTIAQLIEIIAATNYRVSQLKTEDRYTSILT